MAMVHITNTPFIVCASVYIDDYFLPVHKIISDGEKTVLSEANAGIVKVAEETENEIRIIGALVFLVLSAIGVVTGFWFARSISSPVRELSEGVRLIGEGDFTAKVKEKGPPETVNMAIAFNNLGTRLTEYMENLKKVINCFYRKLLRVCDEF